jgi:hypothetical protein
MSNIPCGTILKAGQRFAVCTNRLGHDGAHYDETSKIGWDAEKIVEMKAMRHFFTRDTVEASIWCVKCHAETVHTIMDGRPAFCQACQSKPQPPELAKPAMEEPQRGLFDGEVRS